MEEFDWLSSIKEDCYEAMRVYANGDAPGTAAMLGEILGQTYNAIAERDALRAALAAAECERDALKAACRLAYQAAVDALTTPPTEEE
jgi:hypothetical protein